MSPEIHFHFKRIFTSLDEARKFRDRVQQVWGDDSIAMLLPEQVDLLDRFEFDGNPKEALEAAYANGDTREELSQEYGTIIESIRLEMGLDRAAFSKLVGVTRTSIANWEDGVSIPFKTKVEQVIQRANLDPQSERAQLLLSLGRDMPKRP